MDLGATLLSVAQTSCRKRSLAAASAPAGLLAWTPGHGFGLKASLATSTSTSERMWGIFVCKAACLPLAAE